MKNYLTSIILILLITLISCNEATKEKAVEVDELEVEAPDYEAFDKKVAVLRSFIRAHEAEDLEKQKSLISDSMAWSPPMYNNNKWLGKTEYVAALKSYHTDYDNIKYAEGIVLADSTVSGVYSGSVFPQNTATTDPGAIRLYGTWTATHTATKKPIGVKWYGIGWVDDSGQISMFTEYWDVHGLAAQIKAKK